jgi:hypothetical protein
MTTRVDWPRLLSDIAWLIGEYDFAFPDVRTPAGTPKLAVYLQLSRGAVRNMLDGTEPRHSDGQRLIAVWMRLSGKPAAYVPVERIASVHRGKNASSYT